MQKMTLNKIIKLCNENKQIALSMGIVTFLLLVMIDIIKEQK